MAADDARVAARLDEVSRRLRALEARLADLEAQLAAGGGGGGREPAGVSRRLAPASAPPPRDPTAPWLPGLGRMMLVLAGAYLLRALTEAGALAATLGVTAGVAYALSAVWLTDRLARAGNRTGASLLGTASALVAYPLLWETATRQQLPTAAAALCLALVTSLGLAAASRHRLTELGWLYVLGALVTATGLAWQSPSPALFGIEVVFLGAATAWFAYGRGWWGPRWPVAAAANALVLLLVALAIRQGEPLAGRPRPAHGPALALALLLPATYLATFCSQLLRRRRAAGPFEILQSLGCILAGVAGAALVLHADGRPLAPLGAVVLLLGLAAQAAAFGVVQRRRDGDWSLFYFAGLGLLLMMAGTALVLPPSWLAYVWGALGIAAAAAGGRRDQWILRLHSVAYLAGAAVAAGLAGSALRALVWPAPTAGGRPGTAALTVWLLAILGYALLTATRHRRAPAAWERLPRFLVAMIAIGGAAALVVLGLEGWLARWGLGSQAAVLAAVRSFVLAAAAVATAAASRRVRLRELGWFVGPALVLGGIKLLAEDVRHGTPASLFFGFACFGIALIVAPRLRRRVGLPATADGASSRGSA